MLHTYHHFSQTFGEAFDTTYLTKLAYITYRDTVYDPSQKITPWDAPLPDTNDNTRGGCWKHVTPKKEDHKEPKNNTEVDSPNE